MRLLFLIPSLEAGGAEGQLVLLANGLAARGHEVAVAVLSGGGALESRLTGVRLVDLGKQSRAGLPLALARLVRLVRELRPDVLHGYMPTANVLAALAGIFRPGVAVAFGLRVSNMDLGELGLAGRIMYRLERVLARRAKLVIANSGAGQAQALACGIAADRLAVVRNAVDPVLRPDPQAGAELRAQWGIGPEHRLVGVVARLDPMKDQLGFVRAAALVAGQRPEVRFVLVGGGLPDYAARVEARIAELGLGERFVLTGKRSDMPAVYSALDVLCLPSAHGEGFPNAVTEALACGTPCVVTDVGDAALLATAAGQAGLVAPPGSPELLAQALGELLARLDAHGQELRGQAAAAVSAWTVEALAQSTEELLAALAKPGLPR